MGLDEFFAQLCRAMGWEPTPWRIAVFKEWARFEGMPFERTWNPLATSRAPGPGVKTTSEDIGYGPGNWNSVPVRIYATPNDGIEATRQTLMLEYYPWVRQCFRDQRPYEEARGPRDFTSWVGHDAYGGQLLAFMATTTAPKTLDAVGGDSRLDEVVAAFGGMDAIRAWNMRGNHLLTGYGIEQGELDRVEAKLDALIASLAAAGAVPDHEHFSGAVIR